MRLGTRVFKMADEANYQSLESKIALARRELNNLRSDIYSMKKMFAQKFKEIKGMVETGKQENMQQDNNKELTSDNKFQWKNAQTLFNPEMKPIGFVQSCFKEKNGIPRQPSVCPAAKAKLCVSVKGFTNPEHCLDGLENFSHVWIVFLFHKNTNKAVKAKVKPPRLDGAKVGVFASRSPHRPNPIGLTLAKLDGIVGNTLLLSSIDLLDGTPVLDIKPYVPDYDKPPNLVQDKLEKESSGKTFSKNRDTLRSKETAPVSSGSQLVDQSRTVPMQQIVDLQPEPTTFTLSIAEWIRKPPINELEVKFSDEAIDQICCFHGKRLLPEQPRLKESHRKSDDLSVYRCACVRKLKLRLETFAGEKPELCDLGNNQIVGNPWIKPGGTGAYKTVNTDVDSESSCSEASLNEKTNESIDDARYFASQEELSHEGKSSFVSEEVGGGLKEGVPQPVNDSELPRPSIVCIYLLEMLSSPEEAKQAITDILRADPRSVYRRNCCQDKLYSFSIDTMNVTCKFEESTVEVLRVEPVFYRKLK